MTTPTTRLRIQEMRAAYRSRTGLRITNTSIAKTVFRNHNIKQGRRLTLLSQWDSGVSLNQLTPKMLNSMAEALGCSVKDLTGE